MEREVQNENQRITTKGRVHVDMTEKYVLYETFIGDV